jgi:hypothetical protein
MRKALHSAQRYTAPSAAQRAALHSAQRYTAPSATQGPALYRAARSTTSKVEVCAGPQLPCASLCVLYSGAFWKVLAHCNSTLAFANNKVERFALFGGD